MIIYQLQSGTTLFGDIRSHQPTSDTASHILQKYWPSVGQSFFKFYRLKSLISSLWHVVATSQPLHTFSTTKHRKYKPVSSKMQAIVLQNSESVSRPSHSTPPTHSLLLVRIPPPHTREHTPNSVQDPHSGEIPSKD